MIKLISPFQAELSRYFSPVFHWQWSWTDSSPVSPSTCLTPLSVTVKSVLKWQGQQMEQMSVSTLCMCAEMQHFSIHPHTVFSGRLCLLLCAHFRLLTKVKQSWISAYILVINIFKQRNSHSHTLKYFYVASIQYVSKLDWQINRWQSQDAQIQMVSYMKISETDFILTCQSRWSQKRFI